MNNIGLHRSNVKYIKHSWLVLGGIACAVIFTRPLILNYFSERFQK